MDKEITVEKEYDDETEVFEEDTNDNVDQQDNEPTKFEVFLQKILSDDLTWEGIAAICASAIFIWNIIRYITLWGCSLALSLQTNVPAYLLIIRKNQSFTDAYLVYPTLAIILIIAVNIKPKLKRILPIFFKIGIFVVIFSLFLLLAYVIVSKTRTNTFIRDHFYLSSAVLFYIYAKFSLPYVMFLFGLTYFDMEEEDQQKTASAALKNIGVVLFIVIYLILICSINTECLLDQEGRAIIADLGDQYIVSETEYDSDKNFLYIDRSKYYVIDSSNETVKVLRCLFDYKSFEE